MKEAVNDFISTVRDLLTILSWKETWILPIAVLGIVAVWFVFAWSLILPTPIRAAIIWGLIIGLAILAPER